MAQTHGWDAAGYEALTKGAVGLAAAALIVMVVMAAAGAEGPTWIVQGALAAAAALVARRAGGTTPRNALAFGAFIVGTVLCVVFVGFTIAEA